MAEVKPIDQTLQTPNVTTSLNKPQATEWKQPKKGNPNLVQEIQHAQKTNKAKSKTLKDVENDISYLNRQLESKNLRLKFSVREEFGNRVIVQLMDQDSGEVIRQFPAEEILATYAAVADTVGIKIDQMAK